MIENASWPDAVTKTKALRKAKNLRPNLVVPSIYFNETFVEETVAKVSVLSRYVLGLILFFDIGE